MYKRRIEKTNKRGYHVAVYDRVPSKLEAKIGRLIESEPFDVTHCDRKTGQTWTTQETKALHPQSDHLTEEEFNGLAEKDQARILAARERRTTRAARKGFTSIAAQGV